MRFQSSGLQPALTIAALLVALGWSSFLAHSHLAGRATVLDRIEGPLADLRFLIAGTRPAPPAVTIVAIDDELVAAARQYPLPRATIARLVHELARQEAKVVALDLLFFDPADPDGDAALAEAVKDAQAVVAAAAIFEPGARTGTLADDPAVSDSPRAARVLWPMDRLRPVAGVGLVNISTDYAGTPRHVPLLIAADGALLPSFALRAASRAAGSDPELLDSAVRIGAVTTRTDLRASLPLRFYGPRGTVTTISASQVLRGALPQGALRNRIVVVGATALGTGDTFTTPFDPVLPGVEILATAASHLLAGDGLVRDVAVRRIDATAALLLPAAMILLMALRRVGVGLLLTGLLAGLWIALVTVAFAHGYWFSISLPLAAIAPPVLSYLAARVCLDRLIEQRLAAGQDALRRFHPAVLADRISAVPDFLSRPVQQHAAVLFIDLSGFTGLSEELGPDRTRDLLKALHTLIEHGATEFGGLVLSYMGDGAMIVFGLPETRGDDASRAVYCAVALVKATRSWLGSLPVGMHAERLGVKVGAHYGPVVVSRLGGESYQHITVIGDSVNVASRLMAVASQHGALVAISDELWRAAAMANDGALEVPVGTPIELTIRGRAHTLAVRFWPSDRTAL
jgi:adenylate cyclase